MWDSNAPLQLLKSMPKKLSKENLEKIQMVIDADKYKNSLISGFDLCGMYAPFCRGCKKTSIYPCAVAYINMKKSEGMDVEIDAKPVIGIEKTMPEPVLNAERVEDEVAVSAVVYKEKPAVERVAESESVQQETVKIEKVVQLDNLSRTSVKRKIRIAVARKKI